MLPMATGNVPKNRAFSSSVECKALLHLFKGVSSDCANVSGVKDKKNRMKETRMENENSLSLFASFYVYTVNGFVLFLSDAVCSDNFS